MIEQLDPESKKKYVDMQFRVIIIIGSCGNIIIFALSIPLFGAILLSNILPLKNIPGLH